MNVESHEAIRILFLKLPSLPALLTYSSKNETRRNTAVQRLLFTLMLLWLEESVEV